MDWQKILILAITFLLTALGTVFTWSLNEKSKRDYEAYVRKEERYLKLVSTLKGFAVNYPDGEMRQEFIDELDLCWLYCPDNVIRAGYQFLYSVRDDEEKKDKTPEEALAIFMLTIRKDLILREQLSNTNLTESDFKYLKAK